MIEIDGSTGLVSQHLAVVLAVAEIGGAEVVGATLGSMALTFSPGKVRSGEYGFVIGTAESGPRVLPTVLPAPMLASGPSKLVIKGGTHNPNAPPFPCSNVSFRWRSEWDQR